MSATPPEASTKYSSAAVSSGPASALPWATWLRAGIIAAGLLGAALLVVSEFTTLYTVHLTSSGVQLESVSTSSHDSYALIPIAVLVAILALGAGLLGSRLSLLAIGALGVVTLLIALAGDLPDAQATGAVLGAGGHYENAGASPSTGLYLETLAGVLLVIASGCGLLLAPPAHAESASES